MTSRGGVDTRGLSVERETIVRTTVIRPQDVGLTSTGGEIYCPAPEQRPLARKSVEQMARDLLHPTQAVATPERTTITICRRDGVGWWVVDGQTRLAALKLAGLSLVLHLHVVTAATPKERAEWITKLNIGRPHRSADRFATLAHITEWTRGLPDLPLGESVHHMTWPGVVRAVLWIEQGLVHASGVKKISERWMGPRPDWLEAALQWWPHGDATDPMWARICGRYLVYGLAWRVGLFNKRFNDRLGPGRLQEWNRGHPVQLPGRGTPTRAWTAATSAWVVDGLSMRLQKRNRYHLPPADWTPETTASRGARP